MKDCHALDSIALEVVNLLAKKDVSVNEAQYVLDRTEKIMLLETKIQEIH